jgi:sigma-54 dependent transcriptional regulator, acetoin dehydrogenase operon transcriptional activator AcoR
MLLTGETGTGKEMAQAIHCASFAPTSRSSASMSRRCWIPSSSPNFLGAAPRVDTDADRKGCDGKFRIANNGTLFRDEISGMPLHLQAKLLRALSQRSCPDNERVKLALT